jgi:hypothetical protein
LAPAGDTASVGSFASSSSNADSLGGATQPGTRTDRAHPVAIVAIIAVVMANSMIWRRSAIPRILRYDRGVRTARSPKQG